MSGIASPATTTRHETGPHPLGETAKYRPLEDPAKRKEASGNCANALIGKSIERAASDGGAGLPSQIALIAEIVPALRRVSETALDGVASEWVPERAQRAETHQHCRQMAAFRATAGILQRMIF